MRLPRALRRLTGHPRPRLQMSAFSPLPGSGWLVGGAVRDTLAGLPVSDLDWLVDDPQAEAQAAATATGGSAFPLDERRGHWRVVAGAKTLDYTPLRRPLDDDLRARDYTINALAADPHGRIRDVTGGRDDLERRLLRATSAESLFADPLRILRGPRLAAQLGLAIEPATHEALIRGAALLDQGNLPFPASERVRDELDAMLLGADPARALSELESLGLLTLVLPELAAGRGVDQGDFHHLDVLDHGIEALQRLVRIFPDADLALRWATLLHDVGKPLERERDEDGRLRFYGHDRTGARLAREALGRLRHSSRTAERAAALVRYHMLPLPRDERQARRFAHRRRELLPDLLKLMIADREAARGRMSSEATRRAYRTALARILAILAEPAPERLLLDGNELMAELGLQQGPAVGATLRFLAEAQAVGDVSDRSEAVAAARRFARARGWLP